jgi:hypothetical protein
MRAKLVDRGKPHHALRHLRFDGSVRIERIGHAVDDARFEYRHRGLFLRRRRMTGRRRHGRRLRLAEGRWRPWATPRGDIDRPRPIRLRPRIVERCRCGIGRRGRTWTQLRRQQIRRQRLGSPCLGPFTLLPRGREQQIAPPSAAAAPGTGGATSAGAPRAGISSCQGGGAAAVGVADGTGGGAATFACRGGGNTVSSGALRGEVAGDGTSTPAAAAPDSSRAAMTWSSPTTAASASTIAPVHTPVTPVVINVPPTLNSL